MSIDMTATLAEEFLDLTERIETFVARKAYVAEMLLPALKARSGLPIWGVKWQAPNTSIDEGKVRELHRLGVITDDQMAACFEPPVTIGEKFSPALTRKALPPMVLALVKVDGSGDGTVKAAR